MPQQIESRSTICPYLGLANDQASHFSYPETTHRCYASGQESSVSLEHQSAFCLTYEHPTCSRFIKLSTSLPSAPTPVNSKPMFHSQTRFWSQHHIFWFSTGVVAVILLIAGVLNYTNIQSPPPKTLVAVASSQPEAVPVVSALKTPTPPDNSDDRVSSSVSGVEALLVTPTPTSTPLPGRKLYLLSPDTGDAGWVASGEERGNHFSDSYLYAGVFEDQIYVSAIQFDLRSIPRGAPIHEASLQLTGLRDDRLSRNQDQSGTGVWTVRLLTSDIDENWRRHNYQAVFSASTLQSLSPILSDRDLRVGKANIFKFSSDQIRELETRIIEDENPKISIRIDGPLVGPDNLFAWDTGYGPQTLKNEVVLQIEVGPSPATPPSYKYVVVTSTPTPASIVTAAAIALNLTAEATRVGTATRVPSNMVTATPIPDYLVIVPTTTPENNATAQVMSAISTAEAIVYGTPTPISTNAVTATPEPTESPTPSSIPIDYYIITATPTPESVFIAATLSAEATGQAKRYGTPTPLPESWVTPVVVTSTPTPVNSATAQAIAALSTAQAFTTGTPTPTPSNIVTATPTPVFVSIPFLLPTVPVKLSPTPQLIPTALLGKILFKSDRIQEFRRDYSVIDPKTGQQSGVNLYDEKDPNILEEYIYVYDPKAGSVGLLTDTWPYYVALTRDTWSADKRFRAFTKDAIRYRNIKDGTGETASERNDAPAVYLYDFLYGVEKQLTNFGQGIAYGGVWSPTSAQIAFTSNDSGDDEIWVIDNKDDGTVNLKQLTASNEEYNAREIGKDTFIAEINKYPSWSPDGSQIVFTSNRTGNQQLWIMNSDGSDQRLLMGWDNWTPYNDWAPVWIKYLDPAPLE